MVAVASDWKKHTRSTDPRFGSGAYAGGANSLLQSYINGTRIHTRHEPLRVEVSGVGVTLGPLPEEAGPVFCDARDATSGSNGSMSPSDVTVLVVAVVVRLLVADVVCDDVLVEVGGVSTVEWCWHGASRTCWHTSHCKNHGSENHLQKQWQDIHGKVVEVGARIC